MTTIRDTLGELILQLAHLGYVVADLDAALAEMRRVYGLDDAAIRRVPEPGIEAETRFAFFTLGGMDFEFIEPVSPRFREQLLGMPSGGAGINHLAWQVSSIDAALERLAASGIRPGHVTPQGPVQYGDKRLVYLDPATTGGHVIELVEQLGGSA